MNHRFTLGVISDIHYGPDSGTRKGSKATLMLKTFVSKINQLKPDVVVNLGDIISDVVSDPLEAIAYIKHLSPIFMSIRCPVIHVIGNHDCIVNIKTLEEVLQSELGPRIVMSEGFYLVILNTSDPPINGIGGNIGFVQMRWLADTLKSLDRPCIILAHHALDEQNIQANPLFKGIEEYAYVANRQQVRELLCQAPVKLILQGHLHWYHVSRYQHLLFITQTSFVDTWQIAAEYPINFSIISISAKDIQWYLHGADTFVRLT
jgi:predicted phosphodiesterase